ncbi:MAG: isoprenylcysteine carboxylmethyltransferase family protein [Bacillota bacterium]|nr:isoprenylcysteine carboxylmethyltransferase family protein [Bacillota bacterium]
MGYQLTACIILLLFYGCYFGKMLRQQKQGIQTDQLGRGKHGLVRFIETATKTSAYLVPIVEVISIWQNVSRLPPWSRSLGAVLGFLGAAVFLCSVLTMGTNWRAGVSETDRTELVTQGIYQISRNPAFLGFDLVYLGVLLMFFNWVLFAVSLFAVLMLHLQIVNVEEDFLIETFGQDYLVYQKKVNRYFGRKTVPNNNMKHP